MIKTAMEMLHIYFDKEADYFELTVGSPTNSIFEPMGDGVFKRVNKDTKFVTGFSIHNFIKKASSENGLAVPFELKNVKFC